jgi:YegS/Rv2252/BmrU family lipid kinase
MNKKIRFIVNPRSGTRSKEGLPELIRQQLDGSGIAYDIRFTERAAHATELSAEARDLGYGIVAVAGGDGTMNEAAYPLAGSETVIALLPCGSGNGLARHLGIPVDTDEALRLIGNGKTAVIDTFTAGGRFGVGTFGIGFDAHIAHLFSKSRKRGYMTYVRLVLGEFSRFPAMKIRFNADGRDISEELFLMTFANSSQFGNNAVVAPSADISDGLIDVAMVRPFPWFKAFSLIYRLTKNTLDRSPYYSSLRGRNFTVYNSGALAVHIDGEPVTLFGDFDVKVNPGSLKIIVPSA